MNSDKGKSFSTWSPETKETDEQTLEKNIRNIHAVHVWVNLVINSLA